MVNLENKIRSYGENQKFIDKFLDDGIGTEYSIDDLKGVNVSFSRKGDIGTLMGSNDILSFKKYGGVFRYEARLTRAKNGKANYFESYNY